MDVIALDRAGIAEVVAPNGTAVTEAQLERMWRLDPSPILCFDGDSAGRKAAIRAALRALPHHRPRAHLALRRAARRPGPRRRRQCRRARRRSRRLLASPEPLDARLWRHELDAAPLTTPEARAGLRQRLIDHAATIGDPALRQLYRDEWLRPLRDAEIRAAQLRPAQRAPVAAQERPLVPARSRRSATWRAPSPPAASTRRPPARSILGFANFPEELPAHCEQLAALPIADQRHRADARRAGQRRLLRRRA